MATALAFAVTAIAGILLGVRTSFGLSAGGVRLIIGGEDGIIGWLGYGWGTIVRGVILKVAQTLAQNARRSHRDSSRLGHPPAGPVSEGGILSARC